MIDKNEDNEEIKQYLKEHAKEHGVDSAIQLLLDAGGAATEQRTADSDNYQALAARTLGDSRLEVLALGLAGEAGEVADMVKKHVGHGHPLDEVKLAKELGDVAWYIANICTSQNLEFSTILHMNIAKLRERYPDGFSSEASINRKEGA